MKIGLFGLLTVLFVALKLTNIIAWSWVWVLSPLWVGFLLLLTLLIVAAIVAESRPVRGRRF